MVTRFYGTDEKREHHMKKTFVAILLAGSVSLSACATNSEMAGDVAQGAHDGLRRVMEGE